MNGVVRAFLASLLLCSLPSYADHMELRAMAPDRVGLTVRKSPVLYFFISQATSLPVRFTLRDERSIRPVAETPIPSPLRAGFSAIRLKDYGIQLDEDVQYRWYVSIVRDSVQSQLEMVAEGVIERIDPQLVDYYDQVCNRDSVLLALRAGLWIDGFGCLCELIEANPEDQQLRVLQEKLWRNRGLVPNDPPG